MSTETILIIIGALFIIIGIAGSIKLKDGEVFIKSIWQRVFLFIIGILLLSFGIYKSLPIPIPDPNKPRDCENCIKTPRNNEDVGDFKLFKGNYNNINNDLWIIVWPEKTGNLGYPQSDDVLKGKPAYKSNGKWSVHCHFGGSQQRYDVALYSASENASEILSSIIIKWANEKDYPGIIIHNLPKGLVELDRITVTKK